MKFIQFLLTWIVPQLCIENQKFYLIAINQLFN